MIWKIVYLEIMPSSPPQKRSTTSAPGSLVAAGRGTDAACLVVHGRLSEQPSFFETFGVRRRC